MSTGRIANRKEQQGGSTLPLAGRIKIGDKAKTAGGKEYPTSIDYFRPTGVYADMFTKAFGPQPNKIPIVFITDDNMEACNEYYADWSDGKRKGYGDGETFAVWDPAAGKDGKGDYVTGLTKEDPRVRALKWEEYVDLRFVIPALKGVMGYWQFTTKGKKTSIPGIIKAFDFVKERAGTVVGFPFDLIVEKVKGYSPGAVKNYPIVKLVPNFTEESLRAVRTMLDAGMNLSNVVALTFNEKKLLQLAKEAEHVTEDAVAVVVEDIKQEEQNPNAEGGLTTGVLFQGE